RPISSSIFSSRSSYAAFFRVLARYTQTSSTDRSRTDQQRTLLMPSQLLSPIARQLLLAIAAAVLAHAFATNGLQAQPHPVVGSFDPRFFPGSAPELTGAVFDLHGQLVVTGMFSEFER